MLQVSTEAESEEEVEVSLEQAVKATSVAINNAFFICFVFFYFFSTTGRDRTGTNIAVHRILSPACLPIPPQ